MTQFSTPSSSTKIFRSSVYVHRSSLGYMSDMNRLSAFLYRSSFLEITFWVIKVQSAVSLRRWLEVARTAFHITLISQVLSKPVEFRGQNS